MMGSMTWLARLALVVLSLAAPLALASESSGTRGGGTGIATFADPATPARESITSVRLIDLHRDVSKELGIDVSRVDQAEFGELLARADDARDDAAKEEISHELLLKALARIQARLPYLADRLAATASSLGEWIQTGRELTLLGDQGDAGLKLGERYVQVAWREQDRVIVDRKLYAWLSPLDRAGLRLHEWIYALSGHSDATRVQLFVALCFSDLFARLDDVALARLLRDALDLEAVTKRPVRELRDFPGGGVPVDARPTGPEAAKLLCGPIKTEDLPGRVVIGTRVSTGAVAELQLLTSGTIPYDKVKLLKLKDDQYGILRDNLLLVLQSFLADYPPYLIPDHRVEMYACFEKGRLRYLEAIPLHFGSRTEQALRVARRTLNEIAEKERFARMQAEFDELYRRSAGLPLSQAIPLNAQMARLNSDLIHQRLMAAYDSAADVVVSPLAFTDRSVLPGVRIWFR